MELFCANTIKIKYINYNNKLFQQAVSATGGYQGVQKKALEGTDAGFCWATTGVQLQGYK